MPLTSKHTLDNRCNPVCHFPRATNIPVVFMIITSVIKFILTRKMLLLGGGAYRIRAKSNFPRGCRGCVYKTVCASFTLSLAQVPPVSSGPGPGPQACPGPAGGVSCSRLATPRGGWLSLLFPLSLALPAAFTWATSPGALLARRSVWFGRTFRWACSTAAASVLWEPPQGLRLPLKVCEREVRKDGCVLFVHIGDKRDGGCAPRALPGARHRRLVYKIDHLVAAETPQIVLVTFHATNHAWQVLEGVHVVLRAPAFAVRMMMVVALLVVGDQAVPVPLVARQGGAVVGCHYHVLCGAPSVKVWGDPVAGPHVGFVVGVSSCRGHLDARHKPRPFSVYNAFTFTILQKSTDSVIIVDILYDYNRAS